MNNLYYTLIFLGVSLHLKAKITGDRKSHFVALHTGDFILTHFSILLANYLFDASNYPQDHFLYSVMNKARLCCSKDDTAGKVKEKMILLRS